MTETSINDPVRFQLSMEAIALLIGVHLSVCLLFCCGLEFWQKFFPDLLHWSDLSSRLDNVTIYAIC